ncbi:MAG: hypothetical protein AAF442_08610 [Pseudomonadota bacterium]
MLDDVLTDADFKKTITVLAKKAGVVKTTTDIPASLNAYHAALKNNQWEKAATELKTLERTIPRYQLEGAELIRKKVLAAKGRPSKAADKAAYQWERELATLERNIRNRQADLKRYLKLIAQLKSHIRRTEKSITDLQTIMAKKAMDEETRLKYLAMLMKGPMADARKNIKDLLGFHPTWRQPSESLAALMTLQGKTLKAGQIDQAFKAVKATLTSISVRLS